MSYQTCNCTNPIPVRKGLEAFCNRCGDPIQLTAEEWEFVKAEHLSEVIDASIERVAIREAKEEQDHA